MKKISSKIIIVFLLMIIAMGSTIITSYVALDIQKQHLVLTELLSKQKLLIERVTFTTLNIAEIGLALGEIPDYKKDDVADGRNYSKDVDFMLGAFNTLSYPISETETIKLKFRKEFKVIFDSVIDEALVDWQKVKELSIYLGDSDNLKDRDAYYKVYLEYKDLNTEVIGNADYITKICREEADAKKKLSEQMQLFAFTISIIVFLYIVFYITKHIYTPITEVRSAFLRMSKGDISVRLNRKNDDEFKELYDNFNLFIDNLNDIFRLEDKILSENHVDEIIKFINKSFKNYIKFDNIGITYLENSKTLVTKIVQEDKVCEKRENDGRLKFVNKIMVLDKKILVPITVNEIHLGIVFFNFSSNENMAPSDLNFLELLQDKLVFAFYKSILFKDLLSIVTDGLAKMTESRDPETGNHLIRMSIYSQIIASKLYEEEKFVDEIDNKYIEDIRICATMHDIGKVSVADSILLKPGKLTDEEFDLMKTHTLSGGDVLRDLDDRFSRFNINFFNMSAEIAYSHQEKFDGSGYPRALSASDIPLSARITSLADVFDALTSKRPYKEAFSLDKSYAIIRESRGKHFDPEIVDAFFAAQKEVECIYHRFKDVE
ncbi:MAG: HD domain-containing phosphohydrolase [Acidaminobacteraceae bacterium]